MDRTYEITQLVEVNYALILEDDEDVYDAINSVEFYIDVESKHTDLGYFNTAEAQSVLSIS